MAMSAGTAPVGSVYLHVPFCAQKCDYCAFYSEASDGGLMRRFTDAEHLLEEAALLDNRDINLYILQAEICLALERPEQAMGVREQALELFEGEERIELLFELADVFDDYEEYERVFECIKEVLISEPTNEEALYKICFWTDFTDRKSTRLNSSHSSVSRMPSSA